VAKLASFNPPANLADSHAEAWHGTVQDIFDQFSEGFPQFYDPTAVDTPAQAQHPPIAWTAFPASLLITSTSQEGRWGLADTSPNRKVQDEYCEWTVERNNEGKLTAVTFTTELPEYWTHLGEHDPDGLVELYQELVSPDVEAQDLFTENGQYNPLNKWNTAQEGRLAHLIQPSNALSAAVQLVAMATVLRERDGVPVTNKQDLVDCADLGNPFRNSDPQVAAAVNDAAATGAEVSLLDPIGLYIQGLETTGLTTPDDEDPAAFWTVERGDGERILRARYAVPVERGYTVGHMKSGGRPINFGAQLADRVTVKITAIIKPASHALSRQPCGH
jgi:hypothetical protein